MPKSVVIIGGQAGSKLVYDIFYLQGLKILGFMNNYVKDNGWGEITPKILGRIDELKNLKLLRKKNVEYFVATGDNRMREELTIHLTEATGKPPINAIHPMAVISKFTKIGYGNFIYAGAVINVGTIIGNGTIINTGTIIDHDNVIEDYVQISPNAVLAGYVTVKKGAFISTGASVIPHITIGENSLVAAGAVVVNDVEKETMVAGCPAVFKKRLNVSKK